MRDKNKPFLPRVEETIRREHILPDASLTEEKILVALSGGADSVALLRALLTFGYKVGAAHCNFTLRSEESERDERFCRDLCQELGVPLFVTRFQTRQYASEHGISIEMAARKLRYAYFPQVMKDEGYAYIAVAHHRDDNAETILLNLVRGTGLQGITGMAYRNEAIIRPLLDVSKQDILGYLQSLRQDYVTDSTNMVADARRNVIRLRVMPVLKELNPSITETLVRDAANFREVSQFVDAQTSKIEWQELPDGTRVIDKQRIGSHLILFSLIKHFGFTPSQTFDIWNHLHSTTPAVYLSDRYELHRDRDTLILRPLQAHAKAQEVRFSAGQTATMPDLAIETTILDARNFQKPDPNPLVAYIDADLAGEELILRPTRKGDRFIPFGMKGSKSVSRYMTDHKFDLIQRQRQLVLTKAPAPLSAPAQGDAPAPDILWLVGERPDNRYRIIPGKTRRVLTLRVVFM